jgi:hypothetical protein
MTVARHHRIKFSPHMLVLAAVFTATLTGCTYTGGIGDPVQRKFQYFSYIAGDDIRARCTPNSPAQYRFVYNAHWEEQVRAYDLRRSVIVGEGATLWTQVFGGNQALGAITITDPQAPWRGQGAQTRLTEEQYLALIRAVEASGFGEPSPEGLRNAWRHPSDRFSALTFDRVLFPLDTTGTPVNPPRRIEPALERAKADREASYYFQLMVGRNGFAGRLPPL